MRARMPAAILMAQVLGMSGTSAFAPGDMDVSSSQDPSGSAANSKYQPSAPTRAVEPQRRQPDTGGDKPLRGESLRILLTGAYVTPVGTFPGVIVSHPPGEAFLANGAYQRILGRTRVQGLFKIIDDQVCVEGPGIPRLCRQVIPLGGQQYALVDLLGMSIENVTITPFN